MVTLGSRARDTRRAAEPTAVSAAPPGALRKWWLAARPRTLPLAAAPVLVGTAVAHDVGSAQALPALAALAGAAWLQIGANIANDVFDAERGADTGTRLGPPRAVAQGWLSPAAVRAGTAAAFGLAGLVGLYLVSVGGWPIAALGAFAIAAALGYTAGPWPLAYHGLGEATAFAFFGVAAVGGTAWVQVGAVPGAALLASLPVGALAAAVMLVNNVRDAGTDRAAGKRTLAVRFGARAGIRLHHGLVAGAFAVPVAWAAARGAPALALPVVVAPWSWRLCTSLGRERGAALNETLAGTARLAAVHAALLALGLVLA